MLSSAYLSVKARGHAMASARYLQHLLASLRCHLSCRRPALKAGGAWLKYVKPYVRVEFQQGAKTGLSIF